MEPFLHHDLDHVVVIFFVSLYDYTIYARATKRHKRHIIKVRHQSGATILTSKTQFRFSFRVQIIMSANILVIHMG